MSKELFTFSVRKYVDKNSGFRKLGPSRFSIDILYIGFVFEFWFWRDKK